MIEYIALVLITAFIMVKSNISRNGVFYPPFLLCLLITLGFIIPYPILLYLEYDNPFFLFWPYKFQNFIKALNLGLLSAILALIFFYLGFRIKQNSINLLTNKTPHNYHNQLFRFITSSIYIICVTLLIYRIYSVGGISTYISNNSNRVAFMEGNNIYSLAQFQIAGIYLFQRWRYPQSFFSIKSILTFLFTFFVLIFSNSKSPLFILCMGLFVIYYYRVKMIGLTKILIFSFLGIIFFNLWELVFREYLVVGEFVSISNNSGIISRISDFIVGNFMQLQITSIIIENYPKYHNHLMGSSLWMIFLIFLPRTIFPEKPITVAGELTQNIWPDAFAATKTTIPPGIIGELYMNFSWPGIIIGMFIIGAIYRVLWDNFKNSNSDSIYSYCYIIFISLMLHVVRGELSSPFLMAFFFILPILLFQSIKYKRKN